MRFLLLCPVALLLLAFVGERAWAQPQLVTPKSDFLSPMDRQSKKDFVVVIKNPPRDFNASSTEEVKELRKKLAQEQAKVKQIQKTAEDLVTTLYQRETDEANLEKEKIALSGHLKRANRKLLENQIKLRNANKSLDKCKKTGSALPASELNSLVDKEARRLIEKQWKSIELINKMKYRRLINDLRQRIQNEVEQVSLVEGPNPPSGTSTEPSTEPSTVPLIEPWTEDTPEDNTPT